jgi:transcriptional regulator with XRE-family HTH domain
VGRCLRASRMAREWSLAEVAARTGVPVTRLQSYETGRRTCPLETLVKLAAFYGAKVTDFLP